MSQMKRVAEAAAKLRDSLHFGIMDFPERMGDLEVANSTTLYLKFN